MLTLLLVAARWRSQLKRGTKKRGGNMVAVICGRFRERGEAKWKVKYDNNNFICISLARSICRCHGCVPFVPRDFVHRRLGMHHCRTHCLCMVACWWCPMVGNAEWEAGGAEEANGRKFQHDTTARWA